MTSLEEREDARRREELARCFPAGDPRREPDYWRAKVDAITGAGFVDNSRGPYRAPEAGDPLTEHEQRVLDLLTVGNDVERIAWALQSSVRTIRTTVQRLERKGHKCPA